MRSISKGKNSVTCLGFLVLAGIITTEFGCSRNPVTDSVSTTQAESSGDSANQNARQKTAGIDSNESGKL